MIIFVCLIDVSAFSNIQVVKKQLHRGEVINPQSTLMMSNTSDRRCVLAEIVAPLVTLTFSCNHHQAHAVAPFAPVHTLVPAARVKLTIDRSVSIASNLIVEENANKKQQLLHDLEYLLLMPQNYNRGTVPIDIPQQPAKSYLNAYEEYRKKVSILEKPGAMLVQNGEIDAWKRLKREEKAKEDLDEVRAALNYYTSNLNFDSDKIALTGSKEERSKLIREDRIPDARTVIVSDMGLRYLLRNDILTAMDDAKAELGYQMKQSIFDVDGTDLYDLVLVAQGACNRWFGLITEDDVLAAMDIVTKEVQ